MTDDASSVKFGSQTRGDDETIILKPTDVFRQLLTCHCQLLHKCSQPSEALLKANSCFFIALTNSSSIHFQVVTMTELHLRATYVSRWRFSYVAKYICNFGHPLSFSEVTAGQKNDNKSMNTIQAGCAGGTAQPLSPVFYSHLYSNTPTQADQMHVILTQIKRKQ